MLTKVKNYVTEEIKFPSLLFCEQIIYSQSNYTNGVIQDALLKAKLRPNGYWNIW